MATEEVDYIKKTQIELGALIKKPPLTDKLLSKPPFRFLHDVIMAVIKQTGFMEGLYQGDELDAQKVNGEKEVKIAFLQKAIDTVQMVNGEVLMVKPGKVVAGQEPDRTNEFLRALAKAAEKGPNGDAVKRVLKGEKPNLGVNGGSAGSNKEKKKGKESSSRKESKERGSSKEKSKESKEKSRSESKEKSSKEKGKSGSSSKTREDEKTGKEESGKKSSTKSANAAERRPSVDQKDGEKKRRSSKSAKSSEDKKTESKSEKRQTSASAELDGEKEKESKELVNGTGTEKETKKRSSSSSKKTKEKESAGIRIDLGGSASDRRMDDESINGADPADDRSRFMSHSAKETSRVNENDQEISNSLKPGGGIVRSATVRPASAAGTRPGTASGRPGTAARLAPPRINRRELGASNGPENQGGVGSAIADGISQNGRDKTPPTVVVIQSETKKTGQQDDDDDFIVESGDAAGMDGFALNNEENEANALDGEDADEHGQLVRKILETKKELESQMKLTSGGSEKPVIVFDAQEREKTKKETSKLQETVQQLTRTTHPLAKIVDFLQEDVDSMLKELQQWKQEAKTYAELIRQESGTGAAGGTEIESLKNKSMELDQQIAEQSEAITAIRGTIISNEQRIEKLVSRIARK